MLSGIALWTFIGIMLMALEIFGVPGIGILFAGFSAISVAVSIFFSPDLNDNIGSQLLYFLLFTAFWAAVLWIPLNKFINYDDDGNYSNIIGTYGTVIGYIAKDNVGEVSWSGTIKRAMIDASSEFEEFDDKTHVKISNVKDGIFYIKGSKEDKNT